MTEHYAYIAGLLDGEGHVAIHRANERDCRANFAFAVSIANRHRETLLWVKEVFGGSVRIKVGRSKPEAKNWTPCHDWVATSDSVQNFLVCVLPYLRIKRRQAELVLEFLSTRREHKTGKYASYRTPEVILKRRLAIYNELRELNHAGQQPVTFNSGVADRLKIIEAKTAIGA